MAPTADLRALLFDVFGTVVDWRGSIIREIDRIAADVDIALSAAEIADDWRGRYGPGMGRVLDGDEPYRNLDALHRELLLELLAEREIDLPGGVVDRLVSAWHRLLPWPDAVPGLTRLKARFVIATFSNGNVALLANMAKHAGLPWDVILTPELFATYKRDLDSYRRAIALLGLEPRQTMMVAAHPAELARVTTIGMRTAYVPRPLEFGIYDATTLDTEVPVDLIVNDLEHLARLLADPR